MIFYLYKKIRITIKKRSLIFVLESDFKIQKALNKEGGHKEYKFPVGEAPRFAFGEISFSEDSKWVAYTIYPKKEEAKKLKKQKKKLYNNVGLLNLTSGEKVEFEKAKKFAFSGEEASWIALHKYPPESQAKEKEKWSGSDLILHELASSKELNIGWVGRFEGKRG